MKKAENHLLSNFFLYELQFSRKYVNKKLIQKPLSFFNSLSQVLMLCFPVPDLLIRVSLSVLWLVSIYLKRKFYLSSEVAIYKFKLKRCNVTLYFLGLRYTH